MAIMSESLGGQLGTTTAPVAAPASVTAFQPQPEFIRLPKRGQCPITGLSRSKLYDLISPNEGNGFKPQVLSVSLRRRGQTKGTRLIVLQSLLDYLRHEVEVFQDTMRKASEE